MPTNNRIIKTKFFVPLPTSDFVERKLLLPKFENLKTKPIMMVSASTGFGKSTVIADFFSKVNENYSWLTLSEKENDFTLFIIYLIKAIQIKVPNFGDEVLSLLNVPEPPPVDDLAEFFLNDIAEFDRFIYLALDDYHLIKNSDVHQFIAKLFEYPQPYFRLIILTRRDPELPLPEWFNKNILVEIRSSDLKFNKDEIIEFYKKSIAYQPEENILAKVEEITDGWISGLRMLSLTSQNGDGLNQQFLNFKYKNSRVLSQLVKAILNNQSSETRKKLLNLSLLKEFNVELFAELCLNQDDLENKEVLFNEFISTITRTNLFIIALDDKHNWYRFHHMFIEQILEVLIEESEVKQVNELRLLAADWYFKNDLPDDSIRFYLQADQVSKALEIFAEYRLRLISETRFQQLETIFNLFPKDIAEKKGILLVTKGWLLLQKGNIPSMAKHIEPIDSVIMQEGHSQEMQDLLIGEIFSMKAYDNYLANVDMQACYEHSKQAIKLIKDKNPYATGVAWIFYGAALQFLGQPLKARKDIYKEFESCSNSIVRGQLLFIICFIDWYECDLTSMLKTAEHLLDIGYESNIKLLLANGSVLAGIALYSKGDDEKAMKHLQLAHELRHHTYLHMSFAGGMALASLYASMDKDEESDHIIQAYEKTALKQGGKLFVKITKSASADFAWRYRKDDFGLKWAKENDYKDFLPLANLYSPELVQARILVLDDDAESQKLAQDIINNTIPYFEDRNDNNILIRAFAIQAIIYFKSGEIFKALETLQKANTISSVGQYYRPYIQLGESMKELLMEYKKSSADHRPIVDEILGYFFMDVKDEVHLSSREIEILNIAEGLTNSEVGKKLFVAEKTVKTHLHNIYKKLNVNSKRKAIIKARELGLI